MAKKDTKRTQDTPVTDATEEVVETPVEETEVSEEAKEVETSDEKPDVVEEPIKEESSTDNINTGYEEYNGKFTPDVDGRIIELIVPDGMIGRVTMLLGEYDLIITINEDGRFTVGPFSGDKFNEAVRLVAGCGVMYRI